MEYEKASMKYFLILWSLIGWSCQVLAQVDTVHFSYPPPPPIIDAEYAYFKYDSTLQAQLLCYRYADRYDIDADGVKDSIAFIGNGGAHTYFHFEIWLSSTKAWIRYPWLETDWPYPEKVRRVEEVSSGYHQLVIQDFDQDGIDEIYLNLDQSSVDGSPELKKRGITSGELLVDFKEGHLVIKQFEP